MELAEIQLTKADIVKVIRKTFYTIGHEEKGTWVHPVPYEKRYIYLRHKLDKPVNKDYRLNVATEPGQKEPTWFYESNGLVIHEN